eukprot:maker-scaffold_2-snap-gene-21.65-mRNA-1 protein AED:0.01 eAED:0.01 QI:42/1/1/1/1/1/3/30/600
MLETKTIATFLLIVFTIKLLNRIFFSNSKKKIKIEAAFTTEESKIFGNQKDDVVKKDCNMGIINEMNTSILKCYSPISFNFLGTVPNHSKDDIDTIISAAADAQTQWKTSSFDTRRQLLQIILDFYTNKSNMLRIVKACVVDSGKTNLDAVLGEILPTVEKLRHIIKNGEKILSPQKRNGLFSLESSWLTVHKSATVEYWPIGVLAVVAPFNYPGHNLLNHIISGTFAGNAVVIKVSEHTSFSASFLVRPVREALSALGYNPDLVQVCTGLADTGKHLISHPKIGKIIFTGSDLVGRLIMKQASETLTPVVLELGGKDPCIICSDCINSEANRSWLKKTVMRGVFQNAGQNCIGIERVFLEYNNEKYAKAFVDLLVKEVKSLRPGVDFGALTLPNHRAKIQLLVDDALSKGATLLAGGKNCECEGNYYSPTILTDVTPEMRIFSEEVFGPVLTVIKWTDEVDMLTQVNGTPYGLCSSVFCLNPARAKRISNSVESGMGNVNDFGVNYLCQSIPFGGIKHSGFGCFAGEEGLRACCRAKSITEDRWGAFGVKTEVPTKLAYPIQPDAENTASEMIRFFYAPTLLEKMQSGFNFVKGLASSR